MLQGFFRKIILGIQISFDLKNLEIFGQTMLCTVGPNCVIRPKYRLPVMVGGAYHPVLTTFTRSQAKPGLSLSLSYALYLFLSPDLHQAEESSIFSLGVGALGK
jgi:hypothetical protein